jgi:hypothetical protein
MALGCYWWLDWSLMTRLVASEFRSSRYLRVNYDLWSHQAARAARIIFRQVGLATRLRRQQRIGIAAPILNQRAFRIAGRAQYLAQRTAAPCFDGEPPSIDRTRHDDIGAQEILKLAPESKIASASPAMPAASVR